MLANEIQADMCGSFQKCLQLSVRVLLPSSSPLPPCWMECGCNGWSASGSLVHEVALGAEPTDTEQ